MLKKKRGQITVFIIIGLIILMTYFLLSYYKKETIEERELINPEFIPVQQYVERCTEDLARDAVDIVGLNGGYIYFPNWVEADPDSYLKQGPMKEFKNPYWWYSGKSAIPPLDFISKQISDYTEAGMENCLNNFSAFGNVYDIINLGDFNVITDIGEDDITVTTVYPIEIRDKFNKTLAKLQKYMIIVPIRLKKVHKLAGEIMNRENKDFFIEKKVIDLMSLDDKNIPTVGIEVKCGTKRWLTQKVEDKLKQLMSVNFPYIKISKTDYNPNSIITPYQLQNTNPYSKNNLYNESYYYYHYIWDVSEASYPTTHVTFSYDPKWDIKLYARPNNGKYLESNAQKGSQMLSLFCLQMWHFTYDVIFPVKVTLVDDQTSKNERYTFNFAFKSQINHNQPDRTDFAITNFETSDTYLEEEYCADRVNEVKISAKNRITGDNIAKVNITFICGRYECNMGQTVSDWDSGGIPYLKTRFPYCSNAIIRGSRSGYDEGQTFIQTGRLLGTNPEDNIGGSFSFEMAPVAYFNYTVVKHNLINNGVSGAKRLGENEKAMITIRNKEQNFESYAPYPLEDIEEQTELKLLSGKSFTYILEIYVMGNETIKGGYINQWTVTQVTTRLNKNITFHVVEKDADTEDEQYAFLGGLGGYSKLVPLPEAR